MNKSLRANLLLLLTAMVWGAAFVAQVVATDALEPFTFNAVRMLLGALALTPVIRLMDAHAAKGGSRQAQSAERVPFSRLTQMQKQTLLRGGLICGVLLMVASSLQQLGISMGASAGKAGFITALYIVLVPLLGLLRGKRVRPLIFVAVALAVGGLYLLCMKERFTLEASDLCLILCAFFFSLQILAVDHFSRQTDCVKLSCLQSLVTAILSFVVMLFCEHPTWAALQSCAVPILYAGIMSCAVGYTLQVVAQKDTDPTIASLILCMESVFSVLFGWLILGDRLTFREYLGCAVMLCGILLSQMPERKAK